MIIWLKRHFKIKASMVTPSQLNFSLILREPLVQQLIPRTNSNSKSGLFDSLYPSPSKPQVEAQTLVQLTQLFEKGDVTAFSNFLGQHHSEFENDPITSPQMDLLTRKMKVVALCDTIFFTEAYSRSISFEDAAKITKVKVEDVERLLVHILSIGLLEGKLDGQQAKLEIKAVKPRELDEGRMLRLRGKFVGWAEKMDNALNFVRQV